MFQVYESNVQRRPLDHVCCGPEVGEYPEACATGLYSGVLVAFPSPGLSLHRVHAWRQFSDPPLRLWEMDVYY